MRRTDELERRLRATGTDADKVRTWLERRARPFLAREGRSALDGELRMLAQAIVDSFPLSAWEMAGAAKRQEYAGEIKEHAQALARLLRSEHAPYCPSAIGLFDEESANELCERLIPGFARPNKVDSEVECEFAPFRTVAALRKSTHFDPSGAPLYTRPDGTPTKQPPAKAGGFVLRTESPDTRRLNDASHSGSLLKSSSDFGAMFGGALTSAGLPNQLAHPIPPTLPSPAQSGSQFGRPCGFRICNPCRTPPHGNLRS